MALVNNIDVKYDSGAHHSYKPNCLRGNRNILYRVSFLEFKK